MDISTGDLRELAGTIAKRLRENGFPDEGAANRQVLALAEECGEFVGAFRRWSGQARRQGSFEDVRAELADVVITAFVAAEVLGVDLEKAIEAKADVVFSRGWRD